MPPTSKRQSGYDANPTIANRRNDLEDSTCYCLAHLFGTFLAVPDFYGSVDRFVGYDLLSFVRLHSVTCNVGDIELVPIKEHI